MHLHIPKRLTEKKLSQYLKLWEDSCDFTYSLPEKLADTEIERMAALLLKHPKEKLAQAILADLAEMPICPLAIVEKIFDVGDVGCKVSVALRKDLNKNLIEKCFQSEVSEVREHFRMNPHVNKNKE